MSRRDSNQNEKFTLLPFQCLAATDEENLQLLQLP
jgi:hypothetical protein